MRSQSAASTAEIAVEAIPGRPAFRTCATILAQTADSGAQFKCTATIQPPYNTTVTSLTSDTATLTVVTQAGYSYSATLNNNPVPVGAPVRVERMDYYDLLAWRTNLSSPFEVTNALVRFIIVASDRGSPEQGLIKWTPYPLINSAAAEWAGAHLEVVTPRDYPPGLPVPVVLRADGT